jgi:hypothetical protein
MDSNSPDINTSLAALSALRRFARPRPASERCGLCGVDLSEEHDHLVELASQRLVCACSACSILFSGQGAGKHRRVPRRAEYLPDFRLADETWEALKLPVNMAFFLHSTPVGRIVALYPSPAGATEALISLDAWSMVADDNPVLRDFEPDVEALLVNRVGPVRECYRVGIDRCYKLVGLIRMHWRGFTGGPLVWDEVGRFFGGLKGEMAHA